jgi:hypothetical protein
MTVPYYISEDKSDMRGMRHQARLGAFFQSRGMRQQHHSADDRKGPRNIGTHSEQLSK